MPDTAAEVTRQLTADELLKHPEFNHVTWPLKPDKAGVLTVAKDRRGGPVDISYEIHGHGPKHLIVWFLSSFHRQTQVYDMSESLNGCLLPHCHDHQSLSQ
ncbi:hypothetical protein K402DRAFT_393323 [Aulographum hederae CBS 113979]|uniref:Uncharacterized protein n=1 Tax=Aulographum hederae CBS 113979 TaxID=1176131 RepID=A0A6G1H0W8_9PEZI|nr:hypothetical protein K402DRAFT_393323 [Aulographum hederae CBS 113979]